MTRPVVAALSDLSVTEFLTLSRVGFLPRGLVVGSSVYEAGPSGLSHYEEETTEPAAPQGLWERMFGGAAAPEVHTRWVEPTGEVDALSAAVRAARVFAVQRMRDQAVRVGADGVVGVRLHVEHHLWRGDHAITKFVAMGTAVAFDVDHAPGELREAPSLRLASGEPFMSDLSGQDFVALLRAGYRPITVASGTCVYQLDPREVGPYLGKDAEIATYTGAFFNAREAAMGRLQDDLFSEWPAGHPDAPTGIVGMTVSEAVHRPLTLSRSGATARKLKAPVVEFTAVGTAIGPLTESDPRRSIQRSPPAIVVPLDR